MKLIEPSEGFQILIGENAQENDTLVKESRQDDLWFHLVNGSSPHVILRSLERGPPSMELMLEAARQCKLHSKAKRDPALTKVHCMEAKYVKRTHKPGMVILLKKGKVLKVGL